MKNVHREFIINAKKAIYVCYHENKMKMNLNDWWES
jgi:hypothetical protein